MIFLVVVVQCKVWIYVYSRYVPRRAHIHFHKSNKLILKSPNVCVVTYGARNLEHLNWLVMDIMHYTWYLFA